MVDEVIDIGQTSQDQHTEHIEVIEEADSAIDYTFQMYDCTSSIICVLLFVGFAVLGFFSAVQIFGRVKP